MTGTIDWHHPDPIKQQEARNEKKDWHGGRQAKGIVGTGIWVRVAGERRLKWGQLTPECLLEGVNDAAAA